MKEFEVVESSEFLNGKITIWNDGQESHCSHRARLLIHTNVFEGSVSLELSVYEDSRENALIELNIAFENLMEKFKEDWGLKESYDN